jgi:hypothetical protein
VFFVESLCQDFLQWILEMPQEKLKFLSIRTRLIEGVKAKAITLPFNFNGEPIQNSSLFKSAGPNQLA